MPVMAACPNDTHLPDRNSSLVAEVSWWQSYILYELYHATRRAVPWRPAGPACPTSRRRATADRGVPCACLDRARGGRGWWRHAAQKLGTLLPSHSERVAITVLGRLALIHGQQLRSARGASRIQSIALAWFLSKRPLCEPIEPFLGPRRHTVGVMSDCH
jgi:hypothetical protein